MRTVFSFPRLCFLACALAAVTASAVACSDTDPNYGPPGAIYNDNYKPILGGGSTSSGTSGTSGTTPTDPKAAFKEVFDATQNCAGCHATAASVGNKPENVFYTAGDVDATYAIFKKAGNDFQKDKATNRFYNVAAGHPGPALSDSQKKSMDAWIAAEASGGGTTAADGG